jgi:transposase
MGRPSIDPELMIRMLVVGYVFAIRSERLICREVQVNLAYRWFCKLGIEDAIPDHSAFSRAATSASAKGMFSVAYSSGSSRRASRPAWSAAKVLQSTRA